MMRKGKWDKLALLFLAEVVVILALLPGCFRREKLKDAYYGDGCEEVIGETGISGTNGVEAYNEIYVEEGVFAGRQLSLSPGVYQVRVWPRLKEGQEIFVSMQWDDGYYGAIGTNGMSFDFGREYGAFRVYVADKVPEAYVRCVFQGADAEGLLCLEVWETNLGNRKVLITVIVCFGILDFLVMYRRRILEGKVTGKQQVAFWGLVGCVSVACFPCMTNYLIPGDELMEHLERIVTLAEALGRREFFPLGTDNAGFSLSGGEVFLYFPAILYQAGFSVATAYKVLVVLAVAGAGGAAYFSIYRCVRDEYGALFGSMVYLLAPYFIYNMYEKAAMGEYIAMIFLPLVCCGMFLIYTEDGTDKGTHEGEKAFAEVGERKEYARFVKYRKYKWYVICGMSAMILSHFAIAGIAVLFMILFCMMQWKKTFQKRRLCQLFQVLGITLFINGGFMLMFYRGSFGMGQLFGAAEDVQRNGISVGQFFYWLLHGESDVNGGSSLWVGAGIFMLFSFYIVWEYRKRKRDMICGTFAVLGLLALGMCTIYFPWNVLRQIPGIGNMVALLQYPTRMMSMAVLFMAFLAAFLFRHVEEDGGLLSRAALGIMALVLLASAVYQVNEIVFVKPPVFL